VIVLLLIGFPIALVLAWAYDITPQGIQGTPKTPGSHRRRNLILLIVTAVIISASAGFFLLPRAIWQKIDKSVAVLPFQNLSSDPDNAYFADGIQEEVLTRLAKISDLKVISRTSTQGYQSERGNLPEIAKQLGVANILEGSVQKAGNQVRVNVHLVNVQTGSQLWAETYDRNLSDIFSVETEIAKGIAESLQAKLTGREEQALAAKPTNNPQAYDAYLRGLALRHAAITPATPCSKPSNFMTWQCGLTRILRSPGHDFPVCTRFFTLTAATQLPRAVMRQKKL
jgi:TolB-like protein